MKYPCPNALKVRMRPEIQVALDKYIDGVFEEYLSFPHPIKVADAQQNKDLLQIHPEDFTPLEANAKGASIAIIIISVFFCFLAGVLIGILVW